MRGWPSRPGIDVGPRRGPIVHSATGSRLAADFLGCGLLDFARRVGGVRPLRGSSIRHLRRICRVAGLHAWCGIMRDIGRSGLGHARRRWRGHGISPPTIGVGPAGSRRGIFFFQLGNRRGRLSGDEAVRRVGREPKDPQRGCAERCAHRGADHQGRQTEPSPRRQFTPADRGKLVATARFLPCDQPSPVGGPDERELFGHCAGKIAKVSAATEMLQHRVNAGPVVILIHAQMPDMNF